MVPQAVKALRTGGLYLSYVPTVPQVEQTVKALEQTREFGLIDTFETLLRTWNIKGRSVRPDHRMVAHSGFITVARKLEKSMWKNEPIAPGGALRFGCRRDDHGGSRCPCRRFVTNIYSRQVVKDGRGYGSRAQEDDPHRR